MDTLQRYPNFKIVPAASADYDELTEFFSIAQISNRHLDWRKSIAWIDSQPFLKCYTGNDLVSVLVCPITGENFVWIRSYSSMSLSFAENSWPVLFDNAVAHLRKSSISRIYTIALSPWFEKIINQSGFLTTDNIVTLRKENNHYSPAELGTDFLIRDFLIEDLEQVAEVDHISFPPLWQITREDLTQALELSQNKSVVVTNSGRVIGYQISSNIFTSGHIARVAILPEYQRHKIASALLDNLLLRFSSLGVTEITVNTSSDNIPAINLYLRHGFSHTQNNYPIYTLVLNNL